MVDVFGRRRTEISASPQGAPRQQTNPPEARAFRRPNKTLQMPELELVAQPKLHHAPRIQLRGIVPKTAAEYVNKGVYGLHVEAH